MITIDKLPYIGYLANNKNLLIGTGYNTWGMTNGTLAGFILSELVMNKTNKYQDLFDPTRFNLINFKEYLINISCNLKGFIQNKIIKNKKWYSNVEIKNINGKSVGIYKENNITYKVYTTCPHLGCTLVFNEIDKTWDCPCHASRFNLKGECIKGPSTTNITFKEK